MKRILLLFGLCFLIVPAKALEISEEKVTDLFIETLGQTEHSTNSDFLGIDSEYKLSNYSVTIDEEYFNINADIVVDWLFDFDTTLKISFTLEDNILTYSHVKFGIVTVPKFIVNKVVETSDLSFDLNELISDFLGIKKTELLDFTLVDGGLDVKFSIDDKLENENKAPNFSEENQNFLEDFNITTETILDIIKKIDLSFEELMQIDFEALKTEFDKLEFESLDDLTENSLVDVFKEAGLSEAISEKISVDLIKEVLNEYN